MPHLALRRVLAFVLCALLVFPARWVSGDPGPVALTSTDGSKQLVVDSVAQRATYTSNRGHLEISLANGALRVGTWTISAKPVPGSSEFEQKLEGAAKVTGNVDVAISDGTQEVVGTLQLAANGEMVPTADLAAFTGMLSEFAQSQEGQLLKEAGLAFPIYVSDTGVQVGDQLYALSDCLAAIFAAIAAAISMVAGCGTPMCGPFWPACCAAAVSGYISALFWIWGACRIITF